jgi:hypothetical protein
LRARDGASFANTETLWGFDERHFKAIKAMTLEIYDLCPLAGYPEKYFSSSSLLIGSQLYKIACKEKDQRMPRTQAVRSAVFELEKPPVIE